MKFVTTIPFWVQSKDSYLANAAVITRPQYNAWKYDQNLLLFVIK